jgi:Flp pilus assembly protein TadG
VRNRINKLRQRRKGAALVEFAVVAPVMILFTMGLIDVGRMTMVKQMLINASREGARQATLLDASTDSIKTEIASQLANSGIKATVTTTPTNLTGAAPGSQVTVTVSASADQVSWTGASMFMSGKTLSASTTMRRESM